MRKVISFVVALTALCSVRAQDRADSLILLPGIRIQIGQQGFPDQIQFAAKDTGQPIKLLAENIHFHFTRQSDGKDIKLQSKGVHYKNGADWEAVSSSDSLAMTVKGNVRANGMYSFRVSVRAFEDLDLKDITMHIPFAPETAKDVLKEAKGGWVGMDHASLLYELRDRAVWNNEGKGGHTIAIKGRSMLANNYTGPRHIKKGETLHFNFIGLITANPPGARIK